jgi:O-glycosyl hydrolase
MSRLLSLALLCASAAAASSTAPRPPVNVTFTVHTAQTAQVILGLGFEIQSDSIGSGNHGLPESNTSVPWDLVPSERERFYSEMLTGFRYCRLALGLYFRGLTPDNKSIVERWPGQAAVLAEMATKSGLEGFAVEYWSPAPGWKSTGSYIDGTLVGFDEATLADFAAHTAGDVEYLAANGLNVVLWGLQNEPPVGPSNCIYSCCGYSGTQYYQAFNATARAVKAVSPKTLIHATSWSGPLYSSELAHDPSARALVDLWTVHCVGCDSDVQIQQAAMYLNASQGECRWGGDGEYRGAEAVPHYAHTHTHTMTPSVSPKTRRHSDHQQRVRVSG